MQTPTAPTRRRLPRPHRETGQSLVEFTLMMIFLVVLLMGILDLGRAYFTYLALKDAAAEGAYFASAFPQCTDDNGAANDSPACAGDHNVLHRVAHSATQGGLIDWTDPATVITTTLPATLEAGQVLTVSVATRYIMITPFVGSIANGQELTLSAASAATIIRVPNCTDGNAGCQ